MMQTTSNKLEKLETGIVTLNSLTRRQFDSENFRGQRSTVEKLKTKERSFMYEKEQDRNEDSKREQHELRRKNELKASKTIEKDKSPNKMRLEDMEHIPEDVEPKPSSLGKQ